MQCKHWLTCCNCVCMCVIKLGIILLELLVCCLIGLLHVCAIRSEVFHLLKVKVIDSNNLRECGVVGTADKLHGSLVCLEHRNKSL